MNYNYLAIIPARAGSKRLANKNTLELNGRPLVEWTIAAAKQAKTIDKVVVTTDCDKVKEISLLNKCELIHRPKALASDTATSADMVRHVLENVDTEGYTHFILLQPTSPLRTSRHITEAITQQQSLQADAIISVCRCDHHPYWSNELATDKSMVNFIRPEYQSIRSQDLPAYYRLNGAIYICNIQRFLESGKFLFDSSCYAYEMESKDSVDIDEYIDFKLAEILMIEQAG